MAGFTNIPKLQVEDLGTEGTGDRIALFNSDGELVGYQMAGSGGGTVDTVNNVAADGSKNVALTTDNIPQTVEKQYVSDTEKSNWNGKQDFADPTATTLAIQNASTTQKTDMRIALLGSAVPASPVVNLVNTWYIRRGIEKMLFLSGVNLTPLDPVAIWIENGATKVYATNYYSISSSSLQTFWTIPDTFPLGDYPIKMTFGAVVQGASPAILRVMDVGATLIYDFTTTDFTARARSGYSLLPSPATAVVSNDVFRITKKSTSYTTLDDSRDSAIKTSNIFQGDVASSWEIILSITALQYNTASQTSYPGIFLTETTDAAFTNPDDLIISHLLAYGSGRNAFIGVDSANLYYPTAVGYNRSIVIRKTGSKVAVYGFNVTTGVTSGYSEVTINTSKTYALAFVEVNNYGTQMGKEIQISATILNP